MSEILNGWRNICSTFAPKLSCIGGKTIMVGAGIKSSFRCKKKIEWEINICSTLAPKLSLIGGKPDHDWCINEILFPMSKMLHGKRNIRLTLAPNSNSLQVAVFNSLQCGTPALAPLSPPPPPPKKKSFFFLFFFLPMPKVGGAVYTWVRFIQR